MKILFIEDEKTVAEVISRVLEKEGFEVVVVDSLEAARAEIARSPDVILADLQLKIGSPDDTVRALTPIAQQIPIVACTGHYGTPEGFRLRELCARAGFLGYVDKLRVALSDWPELIFTLRESHARFHALKP